jgi:hypothetical protein
MVRGKYMDRVLVASALLEEVLLLVALQIVDVAWKATT